MTAPKSVLLPKLTNAWALFVNTVNVTLPGYTNRVAAAKSSAANPPHGARPV